MQALIIGITMSWLSVQCPGSAVMWKSWNTRASNSNWARPRFPPVDCQISAGRSADFVQQIDSRISPGFWHCVSPLMMISIVILIKYGFSSHLAWYMRPPEGAPYQILIPPDQDLNTRPCAFCSLFCNGTHAGLFGLLANWLRFRANCPIAWRNWKGPEKTFYYRAEIWPCLVWTKQIGLRISTSGLHCPDKGKWTWKRLLLSGNPSPDSMGRVFARRIIQPPLKCPPSARPHQRVAAAGGTFELRKFLWCKDSDACKPVLGNRGGLSGTTRLFCKPATKDTLKSMGDVVGTLNDGREFLTQ